MPTVRAYGVLIFSLILLVSAWLTDLSWLYIFFSFSLSLLILGFTFSRFLLLNLDIRRKLPEQIYEDQLIQVELRVRNRLAVLDQSVRITDNFTPAREGRREKTVFARGLPRRGIVFSYHERCYRRGHYRIGPLLVRLSEPLGLFVRQFKIKVYSELTVYPRVFPVQKIPFILGPKAPRFGEQTTRISGDYEEFYGIREYHREDGWRRIHWRSTARLGELTVRHFEQSSQWKAMLFLDCHKQNDSGEGRDTAFEYGVSVAASLCRELLQKNASFGLLTSAKNSDYIPYSRGRDHYFRILERLAAVQPDGEEIPSPFFVSRQELMPYSSALIVITSDQSRDWIHHLKLMKLHKNLGIIPIILNLDSFRSQRPFRNVKSGVSQSLRDLNPETYFISYKDELRMHFI